VIVRFPSASMSDGRVAEIMPSELNTADSSAIPEISHEELRRRLHDSSLTIVDVLPEASYIEAHIPGALSLPLEQLASRARELLPDPAAEIAVYCGKFT
jgi:rhodanese-related sulfurtransferase